MGALWHLSMITKPDTAYAVSLSQFGLKPTFPTEKLIVYLLQYVHNTVAKSIRFSGSAFDMHILTDADWAGDILTSRSTTGHIVFAVWIYSVAVQAADFFRLGVGRLASSTRGDTQERATAQASAELTSFRQTGQYFVDVQARHIHKIK